MGCRIGRGRLVRARGKKLSVLGALLVVSGLLMVPLGAQALTPGCGGTWTTPGTQCTFKYVAPAPALAVIGTAVAPGGTVASITVEVIDPSTNNVLVSCSASGAGAIACPGVRQSVGGLVNGQMLICRVRGYQMGTYHCANDP